MPLKLDLIKKLSVVKDELVIDWQEGKQSRLFSHWLRDHCQMPTSLNADNGQRLFSVVDIPKETYIEKAYKDEKGNICVCFSSQKTIFLFFHRAG